MKKDENNKKASKKVFDQSFYRELDLHLADIPNEIDRDDFVSSLTDDGVKEFYHKVAQRFCAIVVSKTLEGGKNGKM